MATAVQLRRGTTTQNNAFTGALGEVSVDTTLDTIRVHDGSTQGGFEITSNAAAQTLTNKSLTAPTITGTAVMATLDISGDVDVDGTLEADVITVAGVALATFVRDTVGTNMFSSNTETGITVRNNGVSFSRECNSITLRCRNFKRAHQIRFERRCGRLAGVLCHFKDVRNFCKLQRLAQNDAQESIITITTTDTTTIRHRNPI